MPITDRIRPITNRTNPAASEKPFVPKTRTTPIMVKNNVIAKLIILISGIFIIDMKGGLFLL